jgi:hypothetical protein
MSNLNVSNKYIIEDHFDNLPDWIDKELFYKDISEQIDEAVQEARDDGDITVDLSYILGTPLISGWIDVGAHGGLLDHYYDDFVYAISKDGPFIEDCFICGRPIHGEAQYIHDEAHCEKCADKVN